MFAEKLPRTKCMQICNACRILYDVLGSHSCTNGTTIDIREQRRYEISSKLFCEKLLEIHILAWDEDAKEIAKNCLIAADNYLAELEKPR